MALSQFSMFGMVVLCITDLRQGPHATALRRPKDHMYPRLTHLHSLVTMLTRGMHKIARENGRRSSNTSSNGI